LRLLAERVEERVSTEHAKWVSEPTQQAGQEVNAGFSLSLPKVLLKGLCFDGANVSRLYDDLGSSLTQIHPHVIGVLYLRPREGDIEITQ
jgi:hypothetical protein